MVDFDSRLTLSSPLQSAHHGFQFGAVYAKSLMLSEQGNPIFVEFLDGEIVDGDIEKTGEYAEARVMAGDIYRADQVQLELGISIYSSAILYNSPIRSAATICRTGSIPHSRLASEWRARYRSTSPCRPSTTPTTTYRMRASMC